MCGIFTILNSNDTSYTLINSNFSLGSSRGPDFTILKSYYPNTYFGFHRLSINGLTDLSNQPFNINGIILICNGEIYNYKQLYSTINVIPKTQSDCEIIIYLYLNYGIDHTLNLLDGEFAFVLYDTTKNIMFVARDPFGVRPLYYLKHKTNLYPKDKIIGFASELKCLDRFIDSNPEEYIVDNFDPGSYVLVKYLNEKSWVFDKHIRYFTPTFSYLSSNHTIEFNNNIKTNISYLLNNAVQKRCLNTERPIACLLSGGLDSSLITALVNDFYKKNNYTQPLETYSIGLIGSHDLRYAKIVADYLGTKHTEIIVSEIDMFNAVNVVIRAVETFDTTTVRASIGNYLIGKYISRNSHAKVILNGDGADELCGGYLYMHKCPDDLEFDNETRSLLRNIHLYDVLRSDKSISSHGLEPRIPFLDRDFVNYYLSIPPSIRNHNNNKTCEKFLLRDSFSLKNYKNYKGEQLLPDEILWRRKEAFSDGVSNRKRSLFIILQEFIAKKLCHETGKKYIANIDTEKMYYKQIFTSFFPYSLNIVPSYWMPKYSNTHDPSARTLDNYSA